MTKNMDKELVEWLDKDIPIECETPRLKKGAPERVKVLFDEWMEERQKRLDAIKKADENLVPHPNSEYQKR